MVPLIVLMPDLPTLNVQNSPVARTVMPVLIVASVTPQVRYYIPARGGIAC
jgi:hypothetical protein